MKRKDLDLLSGQSYPADLLAIRLACIAAIILSLIIVLIARQTVCRVAYGESSEYHITVINPEVHAHGTRLTLALDFGETFTLDAVEIDLSKRVELVTPKIAQLYLVEQSGRMVNVSFTNTDDREAWGVGLQLPPLRQLKTVQGHNVEVQQWCFFSYTHLVLLVLCIVILVCGVVLNHHLKQRAATL